MCTFIFENLYFSELEEEPHFDFMRIFIICMHLRSQNYLSGTQTLKGIMNSFNIHLFRQNYYSGHS